MKWKILREDEPGLFSPTGDEWDDQFPEGSDWPKQSDFIQAKLVELQDADPERRSHSVTSMEASDALKVAKTGKDDARSSAQSGVRKKDGDTPKSGT